MAWNMFLINSAIKKPPLRFLTLREMEKRQRRNSSINSPLSCCYIWRSWTLRRVGRISFTWAFGETITHACSTTWAATLVAIRWAIRRKEDRWAISGQIGSRKLAAQNDRLQPQPQR